MSFYVLLIIIFMHGSSPQPVLAGFEDKAACQTAEGVILTAAAKTEGAAPVIVNDCTPVDEAKAVSLKQ